MSGPRERVHKGGGGRDRAPTEPARIAAIPGGDGARLGCEVEDRALADLGVLLSLLASPLGLLQHGQHALARGAGRAQRAALEERLDRLLVDRAAVDALAEVP